MPAAKGAKPAAGGRWLVKSEPGAYSWDDLVRDGKTVWDGVRNAQARSHLRAMSRGDLVLFYHSGEGKNVVGIAKVARDAYPDPKGGDAGAVVVDLEPLAPLRAPVTLAQVKGERALAKLALVRQGRLSVMPIDASSFAVILALGQTPLPKS